MIEEYADWLGKLALIAALGIAAWFWLISYMERSDARWHVDNPPADDPVVQADIAAQHCAKVLALRGASERGMTEQKRADEALVKSLRDATHQPNYYQAEDIGNNPNYAPRGIENSEEARRLNSMEGK